MHYNRFIITDKQIISLHYVAAILKVFSTLTHQIAKVDKFVVKYTYLINPTEISLPLHVDITINCEMSLSDDQSRVNLR